MTFANGWTISVQFGPGNYCENSSFGFSEHEMRKAGAKGSADAEIAIIHGRNFVKHPDWTHGDDVLGRVSPDEVLKYMNWVSEQP
jgi:hypothetical protein